MKTVTWTAKLRGLSHTKDPFAYDPASWLSFFCNCAQEDSADLALWLNSATAEKDGTKAHQDTFNGLRASWSVALVPLPD